MTADQTSNGRFRELIERLDVGVVVQDAQDTILISNPAAQRILGLDQEPNSQLSSRDPRWKLVDADGHDFPNDQIPSVLAFRTRKPVQNVIMGTTNLKTGERRWLSITAAPIFESDCQGSHSIAS